MRIRSIKPEFWRSDDVAELSREHRLLFIGLWSYVDDNGVGRDDHRLIAADLFPLDDPIEAQAYVREGLATLSRGSREASRRPLIARYTADGRAFLHITSWKQHQRVDKPAQPRFPEPPPDYTPPPTSDDPTESDHVANNSRALATPSRALATPSRPDQGEGNREKGTGQSAGGVTKSTTDRTREREAAIGPPHSPRAFGLVADWVTSCDPRPPAKLRGQLGAEVDGLIAAGWTDDQITGTLQLWSSKGLGPGALASVAHEWANPRRAGPTRTQSTADQRCADAQALKAQLRALPGGA